MEDTPTLTAFLQEQASNRELQATVQTVGFPARFQSRPRQCSGMTSTSEPSTTELRPNRPMNLYSISLSHYSAVAGHPRERRLYGTTSHPFLQRHMANDIIRKWENVVYASKKDLKWSINVSFNYKNQLLNHFIASPLIYWNHYQRQCPVTKTGLLGPTKIPNSLVTFSQGMFVRRISQLYYLTIGYVCIIFENM